MRSAGKVPRQAVIYVRMSLDKYGDGAGVDRQEADCRALCGRLGWDVQEVCTDNDVSASSGRVRPGYERALALVESGTATAFVAWHWDRIARRVIDIERFVQVVESAGAEVGLVESSQVDLSSPSGRLQARILASVARFEVEQKSARQKAANRHRAQDGKRFIGGARPFGWNDDRMTVHPIEGPALADAIRDVTNGRSLRSLMAEWNANPDLNPPRAARWDYPTFAGLLKRPANAGIAVYQKRELPDVEVEWEPIVTRDELAALTAVLAAPGRRTTRGNLLKHYMSGAVICGRCGGPMYVGAVNIRGKHRRVLRCRLGATHAVRSYDPIEAAVTEAIVGRLSEPDASDLFRPRPKSAARSALAEVERITNRLTQAEQDYVAGDISGPQLRSINESLNESLRNAQQKVADATTPPTPERLRRVKPEQARAVWDSLAPAEKRSVADVLVKVTVYPTVDPDYGSLPYGCLIEWNSA